MENTRDAKGKTDLTDLYENFRNASSFNSSEIPFTVAFLVTGTNGYDYDQNVVGSSACEINGGNETTNNYLVARTSMNSWYTSSQLATGIAEM